MRKYVSDVLAAKRDRDRVIALTRQLGKSLGGVEQMGALFKEVFDGARAAGRYFTVFRLMKTFLDLAIVVEQLDEERTREMSDEDLREKLFYETMRFIKAQPEIALWAAAQCPGWDVIPPPRVFDDDDSEGADVFDDDEMEGARDDLTDARKRPCPRNTKRPL